MEGCKGCVASHLPINRLPVVMQYLGEPRIHALWAGKII